jgi:hypothetical protein
MADRLEVSKLTQFVALGPPADNLAVTKLTMLLVLAPGDDGSGGEAADGQAHVYTQRIRRG